MTRVSHKARVWIALWTVYVVWGSTYLGIELAGETIPGVFGAGARFAIVGLVIASVPLWVLLLRLSVGERPDRVASLGLLVGFAGIIVLVRPGGSSGPLGYLLLTVLAAVAWALGSFLSPRIPVPRDALVATGYETLTGG